MILYLKPLRPGGKYKENLKIL